MAVYTPPTETLPIFDSSVFPASINSALTPSTGQSYFLSYPVAQGTQTITNLKTTNVSSTPSTTGDINIGVDQTSGILKLGSTVRTGLIYLGNVIISQISGVLEYSINSFDLLTTLTLFSGASSGFSSGFTTTNFLQGTLFKDMTVNMLTVGSLSSNVSMVQDITIGSGTCSGTGSNSSTITIGNYRTDYSTGPNGSSIIIGANASGYGNTTTTNLRGQTKAVTRDSISGNTVTRNLVGYVDYIKITSTPYTLSDSGNNINLFINIGGTGTATFTVVIPAPSSMNGQYITFRNTANRGIIVNTSSLGLFFVPLGVLESAAQSATAVVNLQSIQLYSNGSYWYEF